MMGHLAETRLCETGIEVARAFLTQDQYDLISYLSIL